MPIYRRGPLDELADLREQINAGANSLSSSRGLDGLESLLVRLETAVEKIERLVDVNEAD
jgi:hypothetical protein